MMQYAIYLNTTLPVRKEADERSEMVTQLLFGEFCEILDKKESFVQIKNYADNYSGWVDGKMLTKIPEKTFLQLKEQVAYRTNTPIADIFCLSEKSIYRLSAGSILPFYNEESSSFQIADKTFQIHPSFITHLPYSSKENIVLSAKIFLNAPYLWGGKSIFGIDCSGFVQTVYSLNGYSLSRDAGTQSKEGILIENLTEIELADLLFFEKDKKITHVGIYIGDNQIIHASGKVRIDRIDSNGIYNEEISDYTHKLSIIRRI